MVTSFGGAATILFSTKDNSDELFLRPRVQDIVVTKPGAMLISYKVNCLFASEFMCTVEDFS